MYQELKNKRILITGASSGIGAGIAKELAKYDTQLILHYNSNHNGVLNTQKSVIDLGSRAEIIQFDFRQEDLSTQFFNDAIACFSGIDILINNAGVVLKKTIQETDLKLWKELLAVNLNVPFLLSQQFANHLQSRQQAGSIINISSIHGEHSCENFSAYAASKAALNSLSKAQAIEWAEHNIRVNTISPGVIEVDRNSSALEANKALWMQNILLERYGTTSEIGELAVFLCSNAAAWSTGQVFTLDGGMTARANFPIRNKLQAGNK